MNKPGTAGEVIELVTVTIMSLVSLVAAALLLWALLAYYGCSQENCL